MEDHLIAGGGGRCQTARVGRQRRLPVSLSVIDADASTISE